MKNKIGLLKRLGILATLLFCLGFVTVGFNSTHAAPPMQPCCNDCEVDPDDPNAPSVEEYCEDYCMFSTHDCYIACVNRVTWCQTHCSHGCP